MPYPFLFHGWEDWQSDYSPLMTSSFNSRHASILRQSWGKCWPCLPMHSTAHTPTHQHTHTHTTRQMTLFSEGYFWDSVARLELRCGSNLWALRSHINYAACFWGWCDITWAWSHIVLRLKTNAQTSCYIVMRFRLIKLICAAHCYGVNLQVYEN